MSTHLKPAKKSKKNITTFFKMHLLARFEPDHTPFPRDAFLDSDIRFCEKGKTREQVIFGNLWLMPGRTFISLYSTP
jgi:hypothetical protein